VRGYVPLLLLLAAIWGSSYLFIKVAVRDVPPAAMVELRLLFAVPVLLVYLASQVGGSKALSELRRVGRVGVVLGLANAALPFTLIAWGEQHVDSGIAAIANATVPIFVVLLALRFRPDDRVTRLQAAGIAMGLVGVAVLAGFNPTGGWWAVAGTLAVVLSSVSYAASNLYAGKRVGTLATGPVLAAASMLAALVLLAPFALLRLPAATPSWKAIASIAALGLLGTALAQIVFYRMLRLYGSARSSLVAYLLPVTALAYGAVLLDEPVTGATLGGLVLILAGVAIGSGRLKVAWPW
jgi:drug/metabolite transporter (DMT)-like permease